MRLHLRPRVPFEDRLLRLLLAVLLPSGLAWGGWAKWLFQPAEVDVLELLDRCCMCVLVVHPDSCVEPVEEPREHKARRLAVEGLERRVAVTFDPGVWVTVSASLPGPGAPSSAFISGVLEVPGERPALETWGRAAAHAVAAECRRAMRGRWPQVQRLDLRRGEGASSWIIVSDGEDAEECAAAALSKLPPPSDRNVFLMLDRPDR